MSLPERQSDGNADRDGHPPEVVRIGIIGCGLVSQVIHIPTLNLLSQFYRITYLCDVSRKALSHCAAKIPGPAPRTTTVFEELCASREVDAVLVCSATAFHPEHAIAALSHDKHVFVEKPLTVCFSDIDTLLRAEQSSKGNLFVGLMRRYAPSFLDAIHEIGDITKIQYARVRDIIGPNEYFVNQTGTFPRSFDDVSPEAVQQLLKKDRDMLNMALMHEYHVPANDQTRRMLSLLGGLGSHDISAMREALGMPISVRGADLKSTIWTAILEYQNFSVVYESGFNEVPLFDCHIEIYTPSKIVRVNYDTPFIKGLPSTMTVREQIINADGKSYYQQREVRSSYEDLYTLEHKEWYDCIMGGTKPKCDIVDFREEIKVYRMLMQAGFGTTNIE